MRPKSSICRTAALPPLPQINFNPDFVYVYIYDTLTYLSQYLLHYWANIRNRYQKIKLMMISAVVTDLATNNYIGLMYTMTFYSLTSVYQSY